MGIFNRRNIIWTVIVLIIIAGAGWFFFSLDPASVAPAAPQVVFEVKAGDGFREVAQNLAAAKLIRSPLSFDAFSLVDGRAFELKPGLYKLSPSMDVPQIIAELSDGTAGKVTVTIPEGSSIFDIDRILSAALVIRPGDLINFTSTQNLEGHLFPDTYQFYTNDSAAAVVREMTDNFAEKAGPLFASSTVAASSTGEEQTLIVASIVEKEVPDLTDQELVAGIIFKRLAAGMPLDIDATVCYAKLLAAPTGTPPTLAACSLFALDFKLDSPYNTYLYKGLPPAPIGNPGTSAITAALDPQVSPYLYYLSDPATGKTIFAKTLDEQNQNRVKYLESNK